MQRLQAFKYELMPTGEQQRQMRRFAGSCRFVFNQALALQQANREAGGKYIGYVAMAKQLTAWRNSAETSWLKEAPVHPCNTPSKTSKKPTKTSSRSAPTFRASSARASATASAIPTPSRSSSTRPTAGSSCPSWAGCAIATAGKRWASCATSRSAWSGGRWFVSVQTRREVEIPVSQGGAVGIDLGIARFATLSDGTFYAPLNSFKRHEAALRKAQQAMSRKTKFSSNWRQAKARVQRIHARIGNARRDYLHKTSTAISQNHALVFVEDLQVRNMSRSAAGTTETPGKQVRAKSGLNRAILDQGWFEFRRQLDYKLAWNGGHLVAMPPRNTSRTCPACGHVSAESRRTQERFACVECGFEENADVVGAINVLRAGHARLACEVSGAVRPPAAGTRRGESALSG
ncbi:RNA-guided endonuclease InsQ/TnpB family protein [Azotobacter sp. CWF10]